MAWIEIIRLNLGKKSKIHQLLDKKNVKIYNKKLKLWKLTKNNNYDKNVIILILSHSYDLVSNFDYLVYNYDLGQNYVILSHKWR